jgi:Protein of unknown function (DUF3485)
VTEVLFVKQTMLLIVAALALGSAGALHGLRTDRWGMASGVTEAASRLDAIPDRIDDWTSQPSEIDPRQLEIGQVVGHISRRYRHQASGQEVLVLIVCGRSGPIGSHSPEVCYEGAGFRMVDAPVQRVLEQPLTPAELFYSAATRPEPRLQNLALWWGWSPDGKRWEAPANPRVHFAREPVLFKLYAIRLIDDPKQIPGPEDPVLRLLDKLLPQIKNALSPE